jgi:hypothetical protein
MKTKISLEFLRVPFPIIPDNKNKVNKMLR